MPTTIPEIKLPNGMEIFCLRPSEVSELYKQIQEYIKYGITLDEGNLVFDVGANVGLFSLWAYQKCNKNLNIYAFEPIPEIFNVLQANAQRFDSEKIKVFPCGLANESKSMKFAYHPNATYLSTSYQADLPELHKQIKEAIIRNPKEANPSIRWLRWLPFPLRSLLVQLMFKIISPKKLQIEELTCQMKTISEIVREHQIEQIDLLKIDAEKGELDVLLGIEPQDWQKIKQVVVEVHELNHRLQKITTLLKEQSFTRIEVEQEPFFKDTNIYNLYAWRE